MKKPLDQALSGLLERKRKSLTPAERQVLTESFWEGGKNAVLARLGTAREAAAAIEYARNLSATARILFARKTPKPSLTIYQNADWARISRVIADNEAELAQWPGVVGFGPGYRTRNGIQQTEKTVIIYVARKLAGTELADRILLPSSLKTRTGDTVNTDVVEFGELALHVEGGSSIGHKSQQWGTLGVFATDMTTSKPVALTAQHVIGDAQVGTKVFAPRPGMPGAAILGEYLRGTQIRTDAAAIAVDASDAATTTITELGVVQGWRPLLDSDIGKSVWMYGAKSQARMGVISGVHINFPSQNLVDIFLVSIEAEKGDSGAAVVDSNNLVLGLLVGEATSSGLHVFTPINLALFELECNIE